MSISMTPLPFLRYGMNYLPSMTPLPFLRHGMNYLRKYHNVINNLSSRNETSLVWDDDLRHKIFQPVRHTFSNDFIISITQTNGSQLG